MKVRILTQQEVHSSQPERHALASGEVVDIDREWAKDLLNRGEAEMPNAKPPALREDREVR